MPSYRIRRTTDSRKRGRLTGTDANASFRIMRTTRRDLSTALMLGAILPTLYGCLRGGEGAKTSDVGDRLRPFVSVDASTGKRYCQVCAFGGRPTLMAVFDLDDPDAIENLSTIQGVLDDQRGLTAFALFGRFHDRALAGPADLAEARRNLNQRIETLALTFPVTILPASLTPSEALLYRPYGERFDLPASGTILLAAADNRVRFKDRLSRSGAAARLKRAAAQLF